MKIGYLMQAGVVDLRQRPLSGPANHVKHVIEKLQILGHEVTLLVFMDGKVWASTDLEGFSPVPVDLFDKGLLRLLERGVRGLQSRLNLPFAGLFDSLRFALACKKRLSGYDLLYERMGWMGYSGALAAKWLGIPLILEVNGDHLTEFESHGIAPRGLQRWLSIKLTKFAAKQARATVATGEGWRQKHMERWQIPPDQIVVIENGSEVVELLKPSQLSCYNGLASVDQPVKLAYLGGFEPWHGLNVLLEAVAQLLKAGINVQLCLIGTGSELDKLKAQIATLGLKDYVSITGQVPAPQFAAYLAEAEIGLSPYCGRTEFSGLKLLDYKAAGLATIASGQLGQPAVLKHGHTGWIVPPCDVEALSQAIRILAENVELRCTMGQNARQEAEDLHSWSQTAREIERLAFNIIGS